MPSQATKDYKIIRMLDLNIQRYIQKSMKRLSLTFYEIAKNS